MMFFQKAENLLIHRPPGWWHVLTETIPELADLAGTQQPKVHHGEGDAAVHTRKAVEACPSDARPDLLWAALLHDIGKPAVTRVDGDKVTSYGHDRLGAEMADGILKRMGMPAHRRQRIVWAVRHHMFHFSWHLSDPGACSARQKRFIRDRRFPLLLELVRADGAASQGKDNRKIAAYRFYSRLRADLDKVAASEG